MFNCGKEYHFVLICVTAIGDWNLKKLLFNLHSSEERQYCIEE